jgi:hypothetical protein
VLTRFVTWHDRNCQELRVPAKKTTLEADRVLATHKRAMAF